MYSEIEEGFFESTEIFCNQVEIPYVAGLHLADIREIFKKNLGKLKWLVGRVTSSGVVKISRLASRMRRSARRGPDPTAVPIKLFMKTYNDLD